MHIIRNTAGKVLNVTIMHGLYVGAEISDTIAEASPDLTVLNKTKDEAESALMWAKKRWSFILGERGKRERRNARRNVQRWEKRKPVTRDVLASLSYWRTVCMRLEAELRNAVIQSEQTYTITEE